MGDYYTWACVETDKASPFELAFENYTALSYGDAVPAAGLRLIGPITALNGPLLIGWSVAIIFEVMRMAEQIPGIGRDHVLRSVIRLTSLDRRRH